MFHSHPGYRLEASDGDSSEMPMQFAMKSLTMRAPFAAISSSIVRNIGAASSSPSFRLEQATKTDYPLSLCSNTKPCPDLAGIGVRSKKLLGPIKINVYSVGVYVSGAAHSLSLLF